MLKARYVYMALHLRTGSPNEHVGATGHSLSTTAHFQTFLACQRGRQGQAKSEVLDFVFVEGDLGLFGGTNKSGGCKNFDRQ